MRLDGSLVGRAPVPATPRHALQCGQTNASAANAVPHSWQVTIAIARSPSGSCCHLLVSLDFAQFWRLRGIQSAESWGLAPGAKNQKNTGFPRRPSKVVHNSGLRTTKRFWPEAKRCKASKKIFQTSQSTLKNQVRIQSSAAVAQLDRVLGYEPRGRGFESCQPHQTTSPRTEMF